MAVHLLPFPLDDKRCGVSAREDANLEVIVHLPAIVRAGLPVCATPNGTILVYGTIEPRFILSVARILRLPNNSCQRTTLFSTAAANRERPRDEFGEIETWQWGGGYFFTCQCGAHRPHGSMQCLDCGVHIWYAD